MSQRAQILIVGLGISGLAAARFLRGKGLAVAVSDHRPTADLNGKIKELWSLGVEEIETGGHTAGFFVNRETIVVSPGVPLTLPVLEMARKEGSEIIGEVELASRWSRIPWLALTGTNGKTTTVTLLGEIFTAAGRQPFVGGNLGRPAVEMLIREHGCAILELSSFQLESIQNFHPGVAIILNFTADHQDRYPDPESYLAAKTAISRNQDRHDYLLLNLDDPHLAAHGRAMGARRAAGDNLPAVLWFSVEREVPVGGSWLGSRVSYDLPTADGGRIRGGFPAPSLKLPGPHNRSNALAAMLAARLQGIDEEVIVRCLENFNGIPHRLEYLGARDQVLFYNDSKATNIDAVVKAVESFDRPLLLLLGGYDKGANFRFLNPLADHFRELIPFGAAAPEICRQLPELTCGFRAAGLRQALERALERAQAGDVVLLAPGCASFDEFSNYRERGDYFRRLVREIGAVPADREK